VHTLEQGNSIT